MAKIVILGAGLTGLSAAYHLEQNNFFDYKIFEKNNNPGGLLRTVKHQGFHFDYTGHLLHINDPYFENFINKISKTDDYHSLSRNSAIFSKDVFTNYPFQTNLYGLPKETIYECINGFINRKTKLLNSEETFNVPENLHDWILKHFGSGINKHFLGPYNKKISAYDIKKITPSWTGRFVPKTSLQAMIYGALSNEKESFSEETFNVNVGYNANFFYPKKEGINFLINQLIKQIQNKVETNHYAV